MNKRKVNEKGTDTETDIQMENLISYNIHEIIKIETEKCLSIASAIIYTYTQKHITFKHFHKRFEN